MLRARFTPNDYMLRIAFDEIDCIERNDPLGEFPHVSAVFENAAIRFAMRHIQNFTWTCERAWQRISPTLPRGAVRRRFLHPRPATDRPVARKSRPKIWIDVTNTYRTGFGGGIGRVALQLADAAVRTGLAIPVVMENGGVREYFSAPGRDAPLVFTEDIVYVVVDSFWEQIEEYRDVCATARARGAKVVACIHDVIPLYYPVFCRTAHSARFAYSFEKLIEMSDACIAVSNHSRREVERAIEDFSFRGGRPLPSTYFHLGANGHVDRNESKVRDDVREVFSNSNVFLSVGTLEPRKGYAVTLDAFDALWDRGVDCRLVIFGGHGWISKSLRQRIIEHPANGTNLQWIADASDAELTFAYRNAHCLIQASVTEGFGLPIVEARYDGTPVIASDIDIFRELGDDDITFFKPCDPVDLADKIEAVIACRPTVSGRRLLRWDQSMQQMVSRITQVLEKVAR